MNSIRRTQIDNVILLKQAFDRFNIKKIED